MQIDELKKDLADREAAYRLLSACYYQPTDSWDEAKLFLNLKGVLQTISPEAWSAAARMHESWEEYDRLELTVDYARLFVGPMALQAPPYGSVYLDVDKKVMGASTSAVRKFYEKAGLVMADDFAELPDHIAVELEFISYLLQQAVASGSNTDLKLWLERAHSFISSFLGRWYRQFCEAIRNNTDNPFYLALADCTELLVSSVIPEPA